LAIIGYICGKWLQAKRLKTQKVVYPSAESRFVYKVRKSRGRYAASMREFEAFVGLAKHVWEHLRSRIIELCITRNPVACSHALHESKEVVKETELVYENEKNARESLRCKKTSPENMPTKSRRTKKAQTEKPTPGTANDARSHVTVSRGGSPTERITQRAVRKQCQRILPTCSDTQTCMNENNVDSDLAECAELACVDLLVAHDHRTDDRDDTMEVSGERLDHIGSGETRIVLQEGSIGVTQVESAIEEVQSALPHTHESCSAESSSSVDDEHSSLVEIEGSADGDVLVSEVLAVDPIPTAAPALVACSETCAASYMSVSASSGDLCKSDDRHLAMYCDEPSLSTTSDCGNARTTGLIGSWHSGTECMESYQYAISHGVIAFDEGYLVQHLDVTSLAEWMPYTFPNHVASLLDPAIENWQIDVSGLQFMQDDVGSEWLDDLASDMIFDNCPDAFYQWDAHCIEDCTEEFCFGSHVFHDLGMETVDQSSFEPISWVDGDEKDGAPPEIVLGEKENEYINLQLIAEMGDWCVLKELKGEQGCQPFFWNRSTGQRTWRIPQIMEETGLGESLVNYAQRLPSPNYEAPFHRRQLRAIRLSHGYTEISGGLRSRRRSVRPLPEESESSHARVPEFSISDEAFPTLKKSFEPSHVSGGQRCKSLIA